MATVSADARSSSASLVVQSVPTPRFQPTPSSTDTGYLLFLLREAELARPSFETSCESIAKAACVGMPHTVSTKFSQVKSASQVVEEALVQHGGRFDRVCNVLEMTFVCRCVATHGKFDGWRVIDPRLCVPRRTYRGPARGGVPQCVWPSAHNQDFELKNYHVLS